MVKRIVVCCDGTWKSKDSKRPSNVAEIKKRIAEGVSATTGDEQVVHDIDGVGTERSILERITGGAFGHGVDEKVREAYAHIATNYEPRAEIYLFGFSRGAYTARSTLGMIRKCGILSRPTSDNVQRAYEFYRNDLQPASENAKRWRLQNSVLVDKDPDAAEPYVPVTKFIGVWDTVGALGVPFFWSRKKYGFHDVALTSWVDNAYHALAIDEMRKDFEPTLWEQDPAETRHQTIEQRWFAGTHSDIGGGIGGDGLQQSERCLAWIADNANSCGLDIDTSSFSHVNVKAPDDEQLGEIHLGMPFPFDVWDRVRRGGPRPIGEGVPPKDSRYGGLGQSYEIVNASALRRQLRREPPYRATDSLHRYWKTHPESLKSARTELGI